MSNPDKKVKHKLDVVMGKLHRCVDKIKPKISPVLQSFANLNCARSCDCDNIQKNNGSSNKNKSNKKSLNDLRQGELTWCRLAYWEERSRVGHQVPISASAVQVFSHQSRPQPGTDAMCLESLFSLNYKPSLATVRTREKIGLGLIINKDEEGVWCHNRTHVPIFVNSPTLDVPNSRTFNVFKIPPGFSMQIFNFELSTVYKRMRDPSCYDGPFDPHSVRLSFAKGWGQNYSRQSVECCPCWLEILLLPPR